MTLCQCLLCLHRCATELRRRLFPAASNEEREGEASLSGMLTLSGCALFEKGWYDGGDGGSIVCLLDEVGVNCVSMCRQ
jgi:hypothetical protein